MKEEVLNKELLWSNDKINKIYLYFKQANSKFFREKTIIQLRQELKNIKILSLNLEQNFLNLKKVQNFRRLCLNKDKNIDKKQLNKQIKTVFKTVSYDINKYKFMRKKIALIKTIIQEKKNKNE